MVNLTNNERYINLSVLDNCFGDGHLYVDKMICGNGFSTSFLLKPVDKGMVNIMIAPNKAVVHDKENDYMNGDLDTTNTIKFVYSDSQDKDWSNADVIVFVTDSFIINLNKIMFYKNKINRILVDESHSAEIQSDFRKKLIDFDYVIEQSMPNCNITSVTASPNKFSIVTHKIENKYVAPQTINYSQNKPETIERLKHSIKTVKKVVIATHDVRVLVHIANRKELKANFIVGDSFMGNLCKKIKVIHDAESELVVISSKGFEGHSIYGKGYHVYFFEDRSKTHETFFLSNLYQAINRTRDGAAYIEYCKNPRSDCRDLITLTQINRFIANDKMSTEQKLVSKYKYLHPFIIKTYNDDATIDLKPNYIAIQLLKEKHLYDNGFDEFKDFLDERKITINYLDQENKRTPQMRFKPEQIIENLFENKELLKSRDIYGDEHFLTNKKFEKVDEYTKHFDTFFIEKNYDGLYEKTPRNKIAYELMEPLVRTEKLKELTKSYKDYYRNKLGKNNPEYKEKIKLYNTMIFDYYYMFIQMFTNDRISVPKLYIAHRDYNLVTKVNLDFVKKFADWFKIEMIEVDIKSAFPRLLYAFVGKTLPLDFYGTEKVNKIAINKALNMCWYNPSYKTSKKMQKQHSIKRLRDLNIDEDVIQFIINRFFDAPHNGALFNYLAFFESKIISKLKHQLIKEDVNFEGLIRRHDSILIFGNNVELSNLDLFEFEGQIGWFKST